MVHRLIRGQPGNGRQNPEGIGGQHDDVLWDRPHVLGGGIGDEFNRVGAPTVLRQVRAVEVDFPRRRVDHDIFQHSAEPLGGRENFRFRLGRQPDHLGIAATFKIEDGGIGPAMFIVADQRT